MRSFNFAFFFTVYVASNVWVYLKAPRKEYLFISIILTLPLLFTALNSLRAAKKQSGAESELLQEALAPYISAFIAAGLFMAYIYHYTAKPGRFFFIPQIAGWTHVEAIELLTIGLALGACGIAVWSVNFSQRLKTSGVSPESTAYYYIFRMKWSGTVRLSVYFLFLLILWVAGMGAVMGYDVALQSSRPTLRLIVVAGRCVAPLIIILIGALLRLPALPLAGVGLLGAAALFGYNTSYVEGGIFLGAQIIIIAVYSFLTLRATNEKRHKLAVSAMPVSDKPAEIVINSSDAIVSEKAVGIDVVSNEPASDKSTD